MCRLRGTRVLHRCDSRRVWHGRGLLHLHRRLRNNGSALFNRNDRATDLTLGRAFFRRRRSDAEK